MEIHLEQHGHALSDCPYCKSSLRAGDELWTCPRCSTAHHADCARENKKCTLLGCGAPARASLVSPGDTSRAGRRLFGFVLLGILICGVGYAVTRPPPTETFGDSLGASRARENDRQYDAILSELISAMSRTADLDVEGAPASVAFNRALALYEEACQRRDTTVVRIELYKRLDATRGPMDHQNRMYQLFGELQAGKRR